MTDTSVDSGVSTPEVSNGDKMTFPVFVIHSRWSLSKLGDFLGEYGDVGFLRIVYDKDGNETDRNIAILPESSYKDLCDDGYNRRQYGKGFVIAPYTLRDNNFPGENHTNTFFIPVPDELCSEDDSVVATINDKLQHLSEWNIIPPDSWSVNVPLKSREKGGIRFGCFVSFKRDVPVECRAMARVLITDTYWSELEEFPSEETPVFRCFWARKRKERPSKKQTTHDKKPKADLDPEQAKETKKLDAMKKLVKNTKPVKSSDPKKTVTLPVPISAQPKLQ